VVTCFGFTDQAIVSSTHTEDVNSCTAWGSGSPPPQQNMYKQELNFLMLPIFMCKTKNIKYKWQVLHQEYLINFLLHAAVLLAKLTGFQLVRNFPAFYGTQRSTTAFTSSRHLALSWASSIQSIPPHPTSRSAILIISSLLRLGLPSGLFPPPKPCIHLSTHPHMLHAPHISFFSILSCEQYWVRSYLIPQE
jgi:hypothetical protein